MRTRVAVLGLAAAVMALAAAAPSESVERSPGVMAVELEGPPAVVDSMSFDRYEFDIRHLRAEILEDPAVDRGWANPLFANATANSERSSSARRGTVALRHRTRIADNCRLHPPSTALRAKPSAERTESVVLTV